LVRERGRPRSRGKSGGRWLGHSAELRHHLNLVEVELRMRDRLSLDAEVWTPRPLSVAILRNTTALIDQPGRRDQQTARQVS